MNILLLRNKRKHLPCRSHIKLQSGGVLGCFRLQRNEKCKCLLSLYYLLMKPFSCLVTLPPSLCWDQIIGLHPSVVLLPGTKKRKNRSSSVRGSDGSQKPPEGRSRTVRISRENRLQSVHSFTFTPAAREPKQDVKVCCSLLTRDADLPPAGLCVIS